LDRFVFPLIFLMMRSALTWISGFYKGWHNCENFPQLFVMLNAKYVWEVIYEHDILDMLFGRPVSWFELCNRPTLVVNGYQLKNFFRAADASQCKNLRVLFLNVERLLNIEFVHKGRINQAKSRTLINDWRGTKGVFRRLITKKKNFLLKSIYNLHLNNQSKHFFLCLYTNSFKIMFRGRPLLTDFEIGDSFY
jgi:hypothetical protein